MASGDQVDPSLQHILGAVAEDHPVAATFTLRADPDNRPLSPQRTRETVDRLVGKAQEHTGHKPLDVNVFDNLQSFAVRAPAAFVKDLLESPEVESALSNEQDQDLLIRPVKVEKRRIS